MADKRTDLVRLLIEKTDTGALKWGPLGADSAEVEFGAATVVVRPSERFGQDEKDIHLDIYSNGTMVESFSDVDLFRDTEEPWYPEMKRLLAAARRVAVGADQVMDEILNSLKSS